MLSPPPGKEPAFSKGLHPISRHRNFGPGLLIGMLLIPLFVGCGYMVGPAYQAEVRTVHVPIFTTDSFRRGVEFQLTEAVQKEIKRRTPFRLTKSPRADTRLTGHIVEIRKEVLGETNFDDPRELQYILAVEVRWEDLRNGQVLAEQRFPLEPEVVPLVSHSEFAPEVGHSMATARQEAVEQMAQQIVEMMEVPW